MVRVSEYIAVLISLFFRSFCSSYRYPLGIEYFDNKGLVHHQKYLILPKKCKYDEYFRPHAFIK